MLYTHVTGDRMAENVGNGWNSDRVKELRLRSGMTQKQFAQAVGVHVVTIIRWEKGAFNPSDLALEKLKQLDAQQ